MSSTLEVLQAQVLSLSKEDRSRLLERLVASLDVDAGAEEEWEAVAAERDAELESGAVVGIPLEDAMARLRYRQVPAGVRVLVVKHDRRRPSYGGGRR